MTKKRTKAGTSKAAAAARRATFKAAYIANGHNATQAAIAAGYSPRTAASQGQRLLKDVEISGELAEAAREVGDAAGLNTIETLEEMRRLMRSDVRKLFNANGTLKQPNEWDAETAAFVSSIEVVEQFEGEGEDRKLSGYVKKLKLWDKNAALEKAMKHLGLYEKDNAQRGESLSIKIELV